MNKLKTKTSRGRPIYSGYMAGIFLKKRHLRVKILLLYEYAIDEDFTDL